MCAQCEAVNRVFGSHGAIYECTKQLGCDICWTIFCCRRFGHSPREAILRCGVENGGARRFPGYGAPKGLVAGRVVHSVGAQTERVLRVVHYARIPATPRPRVCELFCCGKVDLFSIRSSGSRRCYSCLTDPLLMSCSHAFVPLKSGLAACLCT